MKIKMNTKIFLKLFFTILLITKIATDETKKSPEEFLINDNINDTNEKGVMTRERYEILKASASFTVMPYEKFLKIFGEIDFNEKKKTGEITHKQELAFLAENNIEEISHKEETEKSETRSLSESQENSSNLNLKANNISLGADVIPVNHDSRRVYPDCFKNIVRDQQNCGGCW
jgi:hypothetical protein